MEGVREGKFYFSFLSRQNVIKALKGKVSQLILSPIVEKSIIADWINDLKKGTSDA